VVGHVSRAGDLGDYCDVSEAQNTSDGCRMTATFLAVGASILTFIFVFVLLRRGVLREKYAVLWLLVSGVAFLFAVIPGALRWVSDLLGIETPSNLLFFITVVLLVLVSVQLSYELSRHEMRIRRLAEEVALLNDEVRELRKRDDG
jgi:hypothetical protein